MTTFKHALITGASGFVGGHCLSWLTTRYPRLAISVAGRSAPIVGRPGGRFQHELLDLPDAVEMNVSPDIVFHLAGEKRDESRMWDVNFEGTRKLLDWCARRSVRRFVYLSSVGVYGASKNSGMIAEGAAKHPRNAYEASKNAAEELVMARCPNYGIEYVVLQPTNIIGSQVGKTYPLLAMMKMIKRGLFTYFDEGAACFNYVAVEDVAGGLSAAMLPQAANRTFILNSPVNLRQAVNCIADAIGVARPRRRLPTAFGFAVGEVAVVLATITGKSFPYDRERFIELTNTTCYDGNAIIDTTGFSYPLGIQVALRQLARLYITERLL